MPETRTDTFKNIPDALETLSTTTDMLVALSVMLESTMQSGQDVRHISAGVERLFNQQCEDLKFIERSLREHVRQLS